MTKTATFKGVVYWLRPSTEDSCLECAATWDDELCEYLCSGCHEGVWCRTDGPTPSRYPVQ